MTDDNVMMLQPYPHSVAVAVHPHPEGDVVAEAFIDAVTGRRVLIVRSPAAAHQLGEDMLTATTDEDVAAEAQRVRRHREEHD